MARHVEISLLPSGSGGKTGRWGPWSKRFSQHERTRIALLVPEPSSILLHETVEVAGQHHQCMKHVRPSSRSMMTSDRRFDWTRATSIQWQRYEERAKGEQVLPTIEHTLVSSTCNFCPPPQNAPRKAAWEWMIQGANKGVAVAPARTLVAQD